MLISINNKKKIEKFCLKIYFSRRVGWIQSRKNFQVSSGSVDEKNGKNRKF